MKFIKRYFDWVASLSTYKLVMLILLLLVFGSVWAIFIKLLNAIVERT